MPAARIATGGAAARGPALVELLAVLVTQSGGPINLAEGGPMKLAGDTLGPAVPAGSVVPRCVLTAISGPRRRDPHPAAEAHLQHEDKHVCHGDAGGDMRHGTEPWRGRTTGWFRCGKGADALSSPL
jgi:hypothetical protein